MKYPVWLSSALPLGLMALTLLVAPSALAETTPQQLQAQAGETIDPATAANRLVLALSSPAGGPPSELAQSLVDKLKGLTKNNQVNSQQLIEAIKAYNAVVEASNDSYLSSPPPEFLSIFNLLSELAQTAKTQKR